ncbi:MAG: hypothetical protein U5L95_00450 [Candidatus Saccharibacteria bacterium]|nr:hypothetical protein [Candidatus Saccharibacteria bacterium]
MAQRMSVDGFKAKDERLLAAIAEHVKRPLLYARQAAELAERDTTALDVSALKTSADAGLLLVEHYLTWRRYAQERGEPVLNVQIGLSAVMHRVTEQLSGIARQQQTSLKLQPQGRHAPINTDTKLLSSGLSALGLAFIEAAEHTEDSEVIFGVHRTRWGLTAGVYSPDVPVRPKAFKRQKDLAGTSRQLLPATSHSPMSGVAIADALFNQLNVSLRPSRHKGMHGLAVTLAPSPQLSLL